MYKYSPQGLQRVLNICIENTITLMTDACLRTINFSPLISNSYFIYQYNSQFNYLLVHPLDPHGHR